MLKNFRACFAGLKDPRCAGVERHNLSEILIIALCAVLSGGQTAVDMAVYGEAKQQFLRRFLDLKHGIPSHDTFSRVFRRLDPDDLRACFRNFTAEPGERASRSIAVDGKAATRGGRDRRLHMVSAWDCERRQVLAQVAVEKRSGETAAVARLLRIVPLRGAIVTADARNCQRDIARQVVEAGGDYVLPLKANHRRFHEAVGRFLNALRPPPDAIHTVLTVDHGRRESRASLVSTDLAWLEPRHRWPGLAAIGKLVRRREPMVGAAGAGSSETVYYLLSATLSAARLGEAARAHWGVENRLHWPLNVVMNEDRARCRRDHSPYNHAILRHMALNLMHRDPSLLSLRGKFNLAGWQDGFLARLLAQGFEDGPPRLPQA